QTFFTAVKVASIMVMLIVIFGGGPSPSAASAAEGRGAPLSHFIFALAAGLFAYGGWHMVTYTAGETRQPEKTIPRALLFGTLIVTLCYLGLNAAYLWVLPLPRVIGSQRIAADVATAIVGPRGGALVSALVIISAFGA